LQTISLSHTWKQEGPVTQMMCAFSEWLTATKKPKSCPPPSYPKQISQESEFNSVTTLHSIQRRCYTYMLIKHTL